MAGFLVLTYNPATGQPVAQQLLPEMIASGTLTASGAIGPGSINSSMIGSGQIGGAHIAAGAAGVLSGNIAPGSIGSAHIGFAIGTGATILSGSIQPAIAFSGGVYFPQITNQGASGVQATAISISGIGKIDAYYDPISGGHQVLIDLNIISGSTRAFSGAPAVRIILDGTAPFGRFRVGGSVSGIDTGVTNINWADIQSGQIFISGGIIATASVVSGSIRSGVVGGAHIAAAGILSANYAAGSVGPAHMAADLQQKSFSSGILLPATGGGGNDNLMYQSGGGRFRWRPPDANGANGIWQLDWGVDLAGAINVSGQPGWGITFGGGADQFILRRYAPNFLGSAPVFTNILNVQAILSGGTQLASGFEAISAFIGSGRLGGGHIAAGGILSANYASGSIGANHLAAGVAGITAPVTSGQLASSLAHHIEAFITSTDTGGIWSATWKGVFGNSPAVAATPVVASGVVSGFVKWAAILGVSTSNVNGGTYMPGIAGLEAYAASGAVHVMAHDTTM